MRPSKPAHSASRLTDALIAACSSNLVCPPRSSSIHCLRLANAAHWRLSVASRRRELIFSVVGRPSSADHTRASLNARVVLRENKKKIASWTATPLTEAHVSSVENPWRRSSSLEPDPGERFAFSAGRRTCRTSRKSRLCKGADTMGAALWADGQPRQLFAVHASGEPRDVVKRASPSSIVVENAETRSSGVCLVRELWSLAGTSLCDLELPVSSVLLADLVETRAASPFTNLGSRRQARSSALRSKVPKCESIAMCSRSLSHCVLFQNSLRAIHRHYTDQLCVDISAITGERLIGSGRSRPFFACRCLRRLANRWSSTRARLRSRSAPLCCC